jgi:hypothetical protein
MRRFLNGRRPSAAMIIASLALVFALTGTAVAVVGLNGKEKRQVKKISAKQVKKLAPQQVAKAGPSWAIVNAAGTQILAQSGGITITGHAIGQTGLRFPVNTNNAAINAQVTAFGFAGTGAGLFFSKVGPCPTTTDCTTVHGTANTDVVIDTFAPNSNFADAGTFVTVTK